MDPVLFPVLRFGSRAHYDLPFLCISYLSPSGQNVETILRTFYERCDIVDETCTALAVCHVLFLWPEQR